MHQCRGTAHDTDMARFLRCKRAPHGRVMNSDQLLSRREQAVRIALIWAEIFSSCRRENTGDKSGKNLCKSARPGCTAALRRRRRARALHHGSSRLPPMCPHRAPGRRGTDAPPSRSKEPGTDNGRRRAPGAAATEGDRAAAPRQAFGINWRRNELREPSVASKVDGRLMWASSGRLL